VSQPDSATPQPQRLRLPLTRPRWVKVFLAVNVAVFAVMTLAGGTEDLDVLIRFGASSTSRIVQGEVWRLFTANFIHIGVLHLAFNTLALYSLGQEVEALFGSPRFIVMYLLTGLSGSIFSFGLGSGRGLSAGASTALFGLAGTLIAFFVRNRKHFGSIGVRHLYNTVGLVAINLFIGFSVPGIDNLGHLGGLIGGLILGWLLCPFYEVEAHPGEPQVVDRNSLRAEWRGITLFVVLLIAGVLGGLARYAAF